MISKSLITFAKTFYPNKVIVIGSGDEDAATSFGEDTIQSTIVTFTQTAQSTVQCCQSTARVTNCPCFLCIRDFLGVGLLVLKQRKEHPG